MSDIVKIVDELEQKIKKMISKIDNLEKDNQALRSELSFYHNRFKQTDLEINDYQKQIETLKAANALLGSDEFKRETKVRINSIIREIDYCVAQLSE
jgi:chromosome segregation ATPase